MKKLLLLLLISLSFNSYSLYLTCDGGAQKLGLVSDTKPGDAFEFELIGSQVSIDNIFWCRDKPIIAHVAENRIISNCTQTSRSDGVDVTHIGALEISRRTGMYSYNWKSKLDKKIVFRMEQAGKCTVSENTLF
jgi:hypothetical protein